MVDHYSLEQKFPRESESSESEESFSPQPILEVNPIAARFAEAVAGAMIKKMTMKETNARRDRQEARENYGFEFFTLTPMKPSPNLSKANSQEALKEGEEKEKKNGEEDLTEEQKEKNKVKSAMAQLKELVLAQ